MRPGSLLATLLAWMILLAPSHTLAKQTSPEQKPDDSKGSVSVASTSDAPPLWKELNSRQDQLNFKIQLDKYAVTSERFRQSLVKKPESGSTGAEMIAQACIRFAELDKSRISKANSAAKEDSNKPKADQRSAKRDSNPKDTYNLSRFALTADQIVSAIAGEREIPDPAQFYGSFEGKWFGIWDGNHVDHHWGAFVPVLPVRTLKESGDDVLNLNGYQYAWVGDGYGFNYVASSTDSKKRFLLGHVIHLKAKDLKQETASRPHVGVVDGEKRLIWITKGEVFFEEMVRGTERSLDRYYITGFRYSIDKTEDEQKVLSASDAFQVVYSRSADRRQPWLGFKIDLRVEDQKEPIR